MAVQKNLLLLLVTCAAVRLPVSSSRLSPRRTAWLSPILQPSLSHLSHPSVSCRQHPARAKVAMASAVPDLREYQLADAENIQRKFDDGASRVLYTLPTGGGKTVVAAAIIMRAVQEGQRVLVLAHRRELIQQAATQIMAAGVQQCGIIISGQERNVGLPVCVGSVQTVLRRDTAWEFDLLVVDEAHHAAADSYQTLLSRWPDAKVLGLTATPHRLDGKDLQFDSVHEGPKIGDLIVGKHLVPPRVVLLRQGLDLSSVRATMGDFVGFDLDKQVNTPERVRSVVECFKQHAPDKRGVVYGVNIDHSETLCRAFQAAGFSAAHIDGKTPNAIRDSLMSQFSAGDIQVICNCEIVTEGFDVHGIGVIVLARPTQSVGLYLQMVGRGLRIAPNKTECLILDHVGNTVRHGLPTQLARTPSRRFKKINSRRRGMSGGFIQDLDRDDGMEDTAIDGSTLQWCRLVAERDGALVRLTSHTGEVVAEVFGLDGHKLMEAGPVFDVFVQGNGTDHSGAPWELVLHQSRVLRLFNKEWELDLARFLAETETEDMISSHDMDISQREMLRYYSGLQCVYRRYQYLKAHATMGNMKQEEVWQHLRAWHGMVAKWEEEEESWENRSSWSQAQMMKRFGLGKLKRNSVTESVMSTWDVMHEHHCPSRSETPFIVQDSKDQVWFELYTEFLKIHRIFLRLVEIREEKGLPAGWVWAKLRSKWSSENLIKFAYDLQRWQADPDVLWLHLRHKYGSTLLNEAFIYH